MQITVVIPTYQRPELLRKCLMALQKQLLPKSEFEVIVVSDGPDKLTAGVVKEFEAEGNVAYLSLPMKKGPAAARNLGWQSAKAPIVAFTDDDCLPHPQWLSSVADAADSEKMQAFTGRVVVPRGNRPTDYELNTAGLETADFVTANCICTKKALQAVGGFDERFSMAWREDSDLEFKFISQGIQVKRLEEAVVVHPVRTAKWGVSVKEQKKTLFNALLYRKYPSLYRSKVQPQPPYLYYVIISGFVFIIAGLLLHASTVVTFGALLWLLPTVYFIFKRLSKTSLSPGHVLEMICTSFLIPFYSIYWQWYGAVKFRTLFI